MGCDQELKLLAFSLYPLSIFLYSPFKHELFTKFSRFSYQEEFEHLYVKFVFSLSKKKN